MSDIDNDEVLVVPDELAALKSRADLLGVKFHPSISLEKLRDKVNATVTSSESPEPAVVSVPEVVVETPIQLRLRKRREANELIRVRVTCMNPAKKEWEGELFTSGNSLVGSFTKYVPFNADDGWHVPRIILNQIQERQCQVFSSVRDARGNTTRKGKLIREFSVEILPKLTSEELNDLARKQAMANTIE